MATVWKHPKSPYWMAVFRDEQNVWRKKTTKNKNRSEALKLSLEWERAGQLGRQAVLTEAQCREIIGGILSRTSGQTLRSESLREFCGRWLRGKETRRSEGTAIRYAGTVEKLLAFLERKADLPIAAVDAADCERFYTSRSEDGLAPATLVVEMKTIRTIFNAALRQGLSPTNPAAAVELPDRVQQVKRKTFTAAQVQMLLKAADSEWKTAILLGFYAGLRLGDAVTLTWEQVDLEAEKLSFAQAKTGGRLEIPLHGTLAKHLFRLAGDKGGSLCPRLSAVQIGGRSGLSKQFLSIMKSSGISNEAVATGGQRKLSQLSFHALRASFNSGLHNAGVSQELRKKLTGQKSDAVNDRYTQTEFGTLRSAVLKMPDLPPEGA